MSYILNSLDLVVNQTVTIIALSGVDNTSKTVGTIVPTEVIIATSSNISGGLSTMPILAAQVKSTSDAQTITKQTIQNITSIDIANNPTDSINYVNFNNGYTTQFGTATGNITGYSYNQFTTAGTYTWTVPAGVTKISVAAVGGGGGGTQKSAGGSGGGGGLVSYTNSVSVTPGDIYTVVVGAGGVTSGSYGVNGASTYLLAPGSNVPIMIAQGGAGGDSLYWTSAVNSIVAIDVTTASIVTVSAYDPAGTTIIYSISAGSLPTGAALNTASGSISWTSQSLAVDTEYTPFTISAATAAQTISKTFTIKILKVIVVTGNYIVVAGGGPGGAYYYGGGGGAGGLLTASAFTFNIGTTYTVIVGAGGAGGSGTLSNGSNSSLIGTGLSITTLGGGRGGSVYSGNPGATTGGSGGGSSSAGANAAAGTAGPPRQGYDGGSGGSYGGGGGGAGANGTSGSGTSSPTGTGGVGVDLASIVSVSVATSATVGYISGAQVQFAGGGGAGEDGTVGALTYQAPGSAGGGTGATYITGTFASNGQSNTGSGGGGACHVGSGNSNSGSGGSGVVIIRYPGSQAVATGGLVVIAGGYVTHIFKTTGTFTFTTPG